LSAHLIITDPEQLFEDMRPLNYDDDLLALAHDLAVRLLPAFEKIKNGIPYPRVSNIPTAPVSYVHKIECIFELMVCCDKLIAF